MSEELINAGMLSPYRVLDLTKEKGLFCGKLLGDLGADVVVENFSGGSDEHNAARWSWCQSVRQAHFTWGLEHPEVGS